MNLKETLACGTMMLFLLARQNKSEDANGQEQCNPDSASFSGEFDIVVQ